MTILHDQIRNSGREIEGGDLNYLRQNYALHHPTRQDLAASRNSLGTLVGRAFGQPFSLLVICWDECALRWRSIFAALLYPSRRHPCDLLRAGRKIYRVNEMDATAPIRFSTGIGEDR